MIHQQILSSREKILAVVAGTLLIALVIVGYTRTAGMNLQAAAVTYDLKVGAGAH